MKTLFGAAAVAFALGGLPLAHAHDDAYLDSQPTPHAGQMRMAGAYHLELVTGADQLTVYVTDHGGKEQSTAGWSGSAIVLSAGGKSQVELRPAGANTLAGKGTFNTSPDTKVVVSLTTETNGTASARFTPHAGSHPAQAQAQAHQGHGHEHGH